MRAAVWIVLGCLASAPAFAGTWSSLWRTPDQQGEALLAAGHPARAATRFADPRLKAYADLKASRYAQAAALLKPFKDATSEYNRGNALAHSGHLHEALAAYDAALRQEPHDKDIRRNRALVARMLKRRPPKSPAHSGGQGHRHGSQGAGSASHKGAAGKRPGAKQPGKGSGTTGGHSGHGANGTARRNAGHGGSAGGSGSGASAGPTGGSSGHENAARPGRSGASGKRQPGAGTGLPKQGAGQAKRDAVLAAAIARNRAHAGHGTHAAAAARAGGGKPSPGAHRSASALGGGTHTPKRKPVSEKTLALDQWLRQIPNDPAGLLRRKFLIEYMMRHPGENP